MEDLTSANAVEVITAKDASGAKLWVNIDGRCVLRIYRIATLSVPTCGYCGQVEAKCFCGHYDPEA